MIEERFLIGAGFTMRIRHKVPTATTRFTRGSPGQTLVSVLHSFCSTRVGSEGGVGSRSQTLKLHNTFNKASTLSWRATRLASHRGESVFFRGNYIKHINAAVKPTMQRISQAHNANDHGKDGFSSNEATQFVLEAATAGKRFRSIYPQEKAWEGCHSNSFSVIGQFCANSFPR